MMDVGFDPSPVGLPTKEWSTVVTPSAVMVKIVPHAQR